MKASFNAETQRTLRRRGNLQFLFGDQLQYVVLEAQLSIKLTFYLLTPRKIKLTRRYRVSVLTYVFMKSLYILVTLAIITSVSCGGHKIALEDRSPAGRIFRQSCAACHGIDGEGLTIGGKAVPSLRRGKAQSDSDQHLKQQIEEGGKGMPPFRFELNPNQIDDLVRFIRTNQTRQKLSADSADGAEALEKGSTLRFNMCNRRNKKLSADSTDGAEEKKRQHFTVLICVIGVICG